MDFFFLDLITIKVRTHQNMVGCDGYVRGWGTYHRGQWAK